MNRESSDAHHPEANPVEGRLDDTAELLARWRGGDVDAFDAILRDALPWLTAHVDRRLGERLRTHAEIEDFVQEALVEFLTYAPRFEVRSRALLYAFLKRIVENVLRDQNDYYRAQRRSRSRERPLPSDSVLHLDPLRAYVQTPSGELRRGEDETMVRMGLELLDPAERQILIMREWEELPFAQIGERLGITEPAARMRSYRAMKSLAEIVRKLEKHGLAAVIDPEGNGPTL